jgi:hypothetical protein
LKTPKIGDVKNRKIYVGDGEWFKVFRGPVDDMSRQIIEAMMERKEAPKTR